MKPMSTKNRGLGGDGLRGAGIPDSLLTYKARPVAPLGLTDASYRLFITALLIILMGVAMLAVVV